MPINRTGRNNSGLLARLGRSASTNAKINSLSGGTQTTVGGDIVRTYTGTTPVSLTVSNGIFLSNNGHVQPTQNNSLIGPNHNPAAALRVLVVGGGMSGAGGHDIGGHGGGVIDTTIAASSGNYTISVGGGAGNTPNDSAAQNSAVGNSSAFGQTVSPAPAPSSANNNYYGFKGFGQRGTGGLGNSPNTYLPYDGPVAGQPVPGPGPAVSRRGGVGFYSDITGTGTYYGGGGGLAGGVGYETSKGGHGGFGGGGGGGSGPGGPGGQYGNPNGTLGPSPGPAGASGGANTGGGGGSGGIDNCGTVYCSGNAGGSGIVIVRYQA